MTRSPKTLLSKPGWRNSSPTAPHPTQDASGVMIIDAQPEPPSFAPSEATMLDVRARAGLEAREEREHLRERAREVLREACVPLDDAGFDLLISNIRRANLKYEAAFEALLDTGRTLLAIQKTVGTGGYKALVVAGVVRIGETNASKLRQIASAVDSGKIPGPLLPSMPRNLSGAYVIATLPAEVVEPTMKALIDRGMLPECNYRKLESAIRSLREQAGQAADLHRALQRKRTALERLKAEIEELERKVRAATIRTQAAAD
jgi:hypothetical protein